MAWQRFSMASVVFVSVSLLAAWPMRPAMADDVPKLELQQVVAIASGPALPRLTTVIPVVQDSKTSSGVVHLDLSGVVENAQDLWFHANVRVIPGASVQVDETVMNMLTRVDGTFEIGESGPGRTWRVVGIRSGAFFFPKTYFRGNDLRIMLPLEFTHATERRSANSSGQGQPSSSVRATLLLRCTVEGQELTCTNSKFLFGDWLNQRDEMLKSVSELVPAGFAK